MALVRKYKKAGTVEEPKKVLTYENVGTYDAESLAAALTKDLEGYADGLKLTGQARQDFLRQGAAMIQAVKDGNVTKNADGTFSINGNYGLNNTYTDQQIASKRSKGEVGRGAKKYEGQHQKSHGIFTTEGTENFRETNHTIGLVGQWLNKNIKEARVTTPADQKFNISLHLLDKLYHTSDAFKQEWDAVNPKQEDRFKILSDELGTLTDEDYANWVKSDPSIGDIDTVRDNVQQLRKYLSDNDVISARTQALKLGFVLPSIVTLTNGSGNEDAQSDDLRAQAIQTLGVGASQAEIDQYIRNQKLLQDKKIANERIGLLQTQIENLWEEYKTSEKFNAHNWFLDEITQEPAFLTDSSAYDLLLSNLEKYRGFIDNPPDPASDEGMQLGDIIDQLTDAYKVLSQWKSANVKDLDKDFIKNAEYLYNQLFSEVTYNNTTYVRLEPLSTLKYSVLYDAKHPSKPVIRVFNGLLDNNSREYQIAHEEFLRNYPKLFQEGGPIGNIRISRTGAPIDFGTLRRGATVLDSLRQENKIVQTSTGGITTTPEETPKNDSGEEENSDINWMSLAARIAAIVADFTSLGFSFTKAAPASIYTGLAGTGLTYVADVLDNGWNWDDAVNAGKGVALDLFSFFPYTKTARVTRIGRGLAAIAPWFYGGYGIFQGIEAVMSRDAYMEKVNKLLSGKFDAKDIQDLAGLLSLVFGNVANQLTVRRGRKVSAHTTDTPQVMGQDGVNYSVNDTELRSIRMNNYETANNTFRDAVAREQGIDPADVKTNLPYTETTKKDETVKKPRVRISYESEVGPFTEVSGGGTRSKLFEPGSKEQAAVKRSVFPDLSNLSGTFGRFNPFSWRDAPMVVTSKDAGNLTQSRIDGFFTYKGRYYKKQADGSYRIVGNANEELNLRRQEQEKLNAEIAARKAREDAEAQAARDRAAAEAAARKQEEARKAAAATRKATDSDKDPGAPDPSKMGSRMEPHAPIETQEYIEFLNLNSTGGNRQNPGNLFKIDDKTIVSLRDEIDFFNKRNGSNIPLEQDIHQAAADFILRSNANYRAKYQPNPQPEPAPKPKPKPDRKKKRGGKKQQGGILDMTVDVSEILRAGGIIKALKGKKVTSKKDKSVLYGDEKFANWWNGIDPSDIEEGEWDENDFDWDAAIKDMDEILGINTPNTNDDITKGQKQGPYRSQYNSKAGKDEAARREGEAVYKRMTDAIVAALRTGKVNNPGMRRFLTHLQENYTARHGNRNFPNYIDAEGNVLDAGAADRFLNLRTDAASSHGNYSMGPHHSMGFEREERPFYYKGKTQITDDKEIERLFKDVKDPTYQSWDDHYHNKYYVIDDDQNPSGSGNGNGTGNGSSGTGTGTGTGTGNGTEQVTPASGDLYGGFDIGWRVNWGNVNEILRVLALNGQNQRAFEQSIDWDPTQVGYLHRLGLLKGNQQVKDQAQDNAARLHQQAGQNFSNDANLQLAAQLEATDKGNQEQLKAAAADSQEFFRTQQNIQNLANEDLAYNRKAADTNRGLIAEKDKETAQTRAQLTLTKATNLSNLMQGFSKQMFDRYNTITEMLKQRQLLREANRRAAAARVFQAKIDALDPTNYDEYSTKLGELQDEYLRTIGAYDDEDIQTMRKIVGRHVLITPDLKRASARKGRKLTADHHYILQDSKDYNRRKLAEAKEFYKNIRENNKKRKS